MAESPTRLRSSPRICGAWIEKVPELETAGHEGRALEDSIRAFGMAIVSQREAEAASSSEALDAHGTALGSIHRALRRCQTPRPSELSAAIMFLFLSEMLLPSASSSRFHADGLSQLMRAQGPSYYSRGIPHELFIGFRPSIIVWSISVRKASFFGSPEWSTIPFLETPADPLQSLMTTGARIASTLEIIDTIDVSFEASRARACLDSLKDIMINLDDWRKTHFKSALLQQSHDPDDISMSMRDIVYHDVTEANTITHYWAFCIICTVQAQTLQQKFAGVSPLPVELAIPESALELNAKSIMQSVEYLTREEMKLYGAISLTLPLKVSYEYLARHGGPSQAALWERAAQYIHVRGHYYLSNFVLSDYRVLWPLHSVK